MQPKKILMLVHVPQTRPGHKNWVALRDMVRERLPDVVVEMSALNQLTLLLDGDKTRIYDEPQGFDVADFDLVVFRTVGHELEAAIAVAAYCRKKGVPYIDRYIPNTGNYKIGCAFVRWEHDIPVPRTLYGPVANVQSVAATGIFGWPVVIKADDGKKGHDNYLVHSPGELEQTMVAHPDIRFVLQGFIDNDGDYRVLVFNGKPRLALLRTAGPGSHLNNTSQGGTATIVPLPDMPAGILDLAVRAAALDKLAAAGVDVIVDRTTHASYILEVNRAPQLATGANVDLKMEAYATALREILATNPKENAA